MTKHTQQEVLDAVKQHGTQKKAAESLGINLRTLERRLKSIARSGVVEQWDLSKAAPEPYLMGKITVQRNKDGEVVNTWARYSPEQEQLAEYLEALKEGFTSQMPRYAKLLPPKHTISDLMSVYPIGDAHIGMRAWGKETQGQDWDLEIGERIQCDAMAALVQAAPPAEQAVVINLGDWFHADNMEGVTARSGHSLDMDGRYAKMISVGMRVMRRCIDSALLKHKTVKVINVVGNHDDTGAFWLQVALSHAYENEPRVIIDDDPTAFHYVEFGKVLIGCHHGHTCKGDRLLGVMATDQAQAWGRTEHRYWYLGHVHHQSVKELAGVTVESFNTLSAKDAWAAFGGYRARQSMKCIVMHKEFGEVARHTVHPDMLK